MKKKELLPDEDFKEAFDKLKKDIENKETDLTNTKLEEFDIDKAVDCVFEYIKMLPENWDDMEYEQKIILQGSIFHEKPIYDYNVFQTPILSPILQTKKELARTNSSLVGPRGIEPRLPG